MDDNQIVNLFLARDENAIARTAEQYGVRLRGIAYGILGDSQSAEECENDTYLEAWNRIPPHEPRTYLFAFLGRIVRGIALNRYKADRRKKRWAERCELTMEMMECIPSKETPEKSEDLAEITRMMNNFLADCTEEQRKLFVRRYWYCDSVKQIGARYGLAEGTVKAVLFRVRAKLKKYLKNGGYEV